MSEEANVTSEYEALLKRASRKAAELWVDEKASEHTKSEAARLFEPTAKAILDEVLRTIEKPDFWSHQGGPA